MVPENPLLNKSYFKDSEGKTPSDFKSKGLEPRPFMASGPDCSTCENPKSNIFCDLPAQALNFLSKAKITSRYKKGQYLFYSGQNPAGVFCVLSGTVKIESEGRDGTGHILRVVPTGGVIGYRSLFAGEPYQASATVAEDAEVCLIPKDALSELLRTYPELSLRILAHISKELGQSEQRFCRMSDSSVVERIAEAILFLKENFQKQTWTRREIAEWAGTTPETVMRTLASFEDEGLVTQSGRSIEIRNRKALLKKAQIEAEV